MCPNRRSILTSHISGRAPTGAVADPLDALSITRLDSRAINLDDVLVAPSQWGTLAMSQSQSDEKPLSGPKVEDLGDGTARIQIDQVLPWSVAMQILDLMADTTPDEPQHLS